MSPTETARIVASALGQPTSHPGTARLARDLADALTRPIDPAPHDPEPFCEMTGPMPEPNPWPADRRDHAGSVDVSRPPYHK